MASSFSFVLVLALLASPFLTSAYELGKGNDDLKAAMDRAAVLAYRDGKWAQTIGLEKDANLPFICGDWKTLSLYPKPEIENLTMAEGTLADVLQTGTLKAAYVKTHITLEKYDGTNYVALDSTNASNVIGAFAEWHKALVEELSDMFDMNITLQYVIADSPTEALRALDNGNAHVAITPFKTDLTYNGFPRTWKFLSGCPDNGLSVGHLHQKQDDSMDSYWSVMENGRRIGATESKCNLYKMIFVNSEIICNNNITHLTEALGAGELDAISEAVPGQTVPVQGSLPTNTFGSLYRQEDECAALHASPSEKLAVWGALVMMVLGWLMAL